MFSTSANPCASGVTSQASSATKSTFRRVRTDPLVFVFPSDHRLASHATVAPQEIVGETFYLPSKSAPTVRRIVLDYLGQAGRPQTRPRSAQRCPCDLDDRIDAWRHDPAGLHQAIFAADDHHTACAWRGTCD
ncbi:hypothetical protein IVB29_33340 [Bradyrhizobium sp. 1]|nr:hypothetical protein [Bradyrhizobium sp. 1]